MKSQTIVNKAKAICKLLIFTLLGVMVLAIGAYLFYLNNVTKRVIKPVFQLENPTSSGVAANFYGSIPPEILVSKNKHIHLVNLFGSRCFRHFAVAFLSFSPDGSQLISAGERTIKLWNISSQKEIRVFRGHARWICSAIFSPDGKKIVSGSADKTIKIWDVSSGAEICTLHGHTDSVLSVAFSPDGTKIASGSEDKSVKIWDVSAGTEIHTLYGHTDRVKRVIFSPDGTKIASGSWDKTVKIWNVFTGNLIHTLSNSKSKRSVSSLAFSTDGTKIVSGYADRFITIWAVAMGAEIYTFDVYNPISIMFCSNDAKIIAICRDEIKILDIKTGNPLLSLEASVKNAAISPDGKKVVSADSTNFLSLWDLSEKKRIHLSYTGHTGEVNAVDFSPNGNRLVSVGADSVKIWDARTGAELFTREDAHIRNNVCVSFSPDGKYILSAGEEGDVKLWNATLGIIAKFFPKSSAYCVQNSVVFSLDGSQIFFASGNDISVWNINSKKRNYCKIAGDLTGESHLDFSSDRSKIITEDVQGIIRIVKVADGQEIGRLGNPGEVIKYLAFSPDGSKIACATNDGRVKIFESYSKKEIHTLQVQTVLPDQVSIISTIVAFSPDGLKLVSAGWDNLIKIWDVSTGKEIDSIVCDGIPSCIKFSPDGKWMLVGNRDTTIMLYSWQ